MAVSLPWPIRITNVALLLFCVAWLLTAGTAKDRLQRLRDNKSVWAFVAFYGVMLLGLLYTNDTSQGIFALDVHLPLSLLPLLIASGPVLIQKQVELAKSGFVYSCIAASAVCVAYVLYAHFSQADISPQNFDFITQDRYHESNPGASPAWQQLSYIQFGRVLNLHPTYFSFYALTAILFVSSGSVKPGYLKHAIILFFGMVIILLSSRISALGLILLGSTLIYRHFDVKQMRVQGIAAVTAFIPAVVMVTWLNPVSRYRLWQEPAGAIAATETAISPWNSVKSRVVEWRASMHVISNHIPFGTGTGGSSKALGAYYRQAGTAYLGYNAHNQFLETTAELGLPGLAALVACFAVGFRYALRARQFTFLSFLTLFAIFCMTESMLERQKGIVCFSLVTSMYLFATPKV